MATTSKKVHTGKLSEECKLWDTCKDKACVEEFKAVYGANWKHPKATIIWSIPLCYALNDLMKKGLVKQK